MSTARTSNDDTVLITTERLRLVSLSGEHLDGPYIDWLNDPEVCRYNRHGEVTYTRVLAEEYLASLKGSDDVVLAVHLLRDGRHIGNISLQGIDWANRSADFAILMGDRAAWGGGYATEAGRALVRYGFDHLGLHRITAGTMVEHEAMRALAIRLGMSQEGVLREAMFKHGEPHDVAIYAVLADTEPRQQIRDRRGDPAGGSPVPK